MEFRSHVKGMANFQVSKEYVRGQLMSMGIQNVSEEDLEAYTRDFSRLVEGHLDHSTSSETVTSSQSGTCRDGVAVAGEPRHSHIHRLSATSSQHTPVNPTICNMQQPGSAVFKTFPGDKENRVHFLSPSPSPKLSPATKSHRSDGFPNSSLLSSASVSSVGSLGQGADKSRTKRGVKRKVLRKCNGEVKVFDESISDYGVDSPSERIADLSGRLCDLSVTSRGSSVGGSFLTNGAGCGRGEGDPRHDIASYKSHCCRSFIRPPLSHPHTRGLRKSDPVTRYHEFRQAWAAHKAPGEKSRNGLRWHIREQLTHQDVPYYEPRRNIRKSNDFVVPTDKKRSELRWEVRHTLAHQ